MERLYSIKRVVWLCGIIFGSLDLAAAEPYTCSRTIEAFDCLQPSKLIGRFEAQTSLEIGDFVPNTKMFQVLYKTPDGTEIRALCRPEDLDRKPPPESASSSPPTPAPRKTQGIPGSALTNQPPLFASIQQFEPDLWSTPSSKFAMMHSSFGFQWVSVADTNESRCDNPLTFFGHPIYETIVKFQNNRLDEIKFLLFGRGDSRTDMEEERFQKFMAALEKSLDSWTGAKGMDAWISGNAADTKRKSWFKFPIRIDLEWSVTRNAKETFAGIDVKKTRFRTEFIRMVLSSYDGKQDAAQLVKANFQKSQPSTLRRSDLKERVKHENNGDVYLDGVPMVNQGQKGYCVCASAERVMRFYGLDIDQNEMAKNSNTLTKGGTNPDAMFKALKKLGDQFSLVVREHRSFDLRNFFQEVEAYNRLAKKNHQQEIPLSTQGIIYISDAYELMAPDLFKEVRLKKTNDKTKFTSEVSELIEKGAPALWSVQLGLVEETPALPQIRGGHMRLIIGYNKKTSEIIYTDSWGQGHEFKRMSIDDAFCITEALYSVIPST